MIFLTVAIYLSTMAVIYGVGFRVGQQSGREQLKRQVIPYLRNCSATSHANAMRLMRPRQ